MRYREFAPGPALRPHVHCYWELEGWTQDPQVIYPDGRCDLVFHYGAPFIAGGEEQGSTLFVGQMERCVSIQPQGRVGVFGIRFTPASAWRVFGISQFELRGTVTDAFALGVDGLREMTDRVMTAPSASSRMAIAEEFLVGRIRPGTDLFDALAGELLRGSVSNRQAREELGVSERTWERLFQDRVGVTPKRIQRIGRFRRALLLGESGWGWADVAAACGYSDQSHLVRDFREMTGDSPTRAAPDLLAE